MKDADSVRNQQQHHVQQYSCTLDECFQLYTKEEQVVRPLSFDDVAGFTLFIKLKYCRKSIPVLIFTQTDRYYLNEEIFKAGCILFSMDDGKLKFCLPLCVIMRNSGTANIV